MTHAAEPLRVRDIMSSEVVTIDPECSLRDAVELLAARRITGAPVVALGRIVGVLSASDILDYESTMPAAASGAARAFDPADGESADAWREDAGAAASYFAELWPDTEADVLERMTAADTAEWDVLGEHSVEDAMSPATCTVAGDAAVAAAAEAMLRARTHRALVLDGEALAGIVTATDILRAVAQGGVPA